MTPIEKAETALNARIERIRANLLETESESKRQFLFQSLVVSMGLGEALTGYVRMIGEYARGRHGELKQTHDTLSAQHAEVLRSGQELLERLKANPTDKTLRKEIEAAQRGMAAIQRNLKRGANALQRDVAPSIAMIDKIALSVRRLCEAGQIDALKRVLTLFVENVRELYVSHPTLPSKTIFDAAAFEKTALAEIEQATAFYQAYALAGYQAMSALDLMTLAVSATPPGTAGEAITRASEAAAARVKAITARFSTS